MKKMFIGLGGLGSKVVEKIRQYALDMTPATADDWRIDNQFVVLDQDEHDFDYLIHQCNIPCNPLRKVGTARMYMEHYPQLQIEEWFPQLDIPVEQMGMNRAVGRLLFLTADLEDRLQTLKNQLERLYWDREFGAQPQIIVVTSLCGGTGAGMFIDLALWLRNYVASRFGEAAMLRAVLVGPEVFIGPAKLAERDLERCDKLRANAHAALKELETVNSLRSGWDVPEYPQTWSWRQDANTGRLFNQVYLYEGDAKVTFEAHMALIARGAYLSAVPWVAADTAGIHMVTKREDALLCNCFNTAVACCDPAAVAHWCATEAAKSLQLPETDLNTQEENFVTDHIQRVWTMLRSEVYQWIRQNSKQVRIDIPEELSRGQIEQFARQLLRELDRANAGMEQIASEAANVLYHRLCDVNPDARHGQSEWNCTLMLDREGRFLPPAQIRRVLEKAVDMVDIVLMQHAKNCPITADNMGPIAPDFTKKEICQIPGEAYPLVVWRGNQTTSLLGGQRFCKRYLNWFEDYCQWYQEEGVRYAAICVMRRLLPNLRTELLRLLEAQKELDKALKNQLSSQQTGNRQEPDALAVCANEQSCAKIYGTLPAAQDASVLYGCYAEAMCHNGTERCATLLQCLRKQIWEESQAIALQDVVAGWLQSQTVDLDHDPPDVVDRCLMELIERLYSRARTAKRTGCYSATFMGISSACAMKNRLRLLASGEQQLRTGVDETLNAEYLWCMHVDMGIPVTEFAAWKNDSYREAYERTRALAIQTGNGHYEPHTDRRW